MRQALELALEALQFALHVGFPESSESQIKKGEKAYQQHRAAITAIKEALAQPEQWGASAVTHPEYIDEQKAKTQELRSMLAQPEQEPVAWMYESVCGNDFATRHKPPDYGKNIRPLYTTPPQRKPLTDEQLKPLIQKAMMYYGHNPEHWTVTAGAGFCILARAIEAAHGIKE